jgi:major membrane immunogen (membrane-anchored lipoprotein)
MKAMRFTLSLATATILLVSCSKKDVSGPSGVNFQLKATNTVTTLNSRTDAATITWTSGTATPTSVKFEATQSASEIEFSSTANQQVDLFAAASSFGNITLPAGTYNEIELKMQLNGTTSAPALELNGTFNNGTTNIPVKFQVTTSLLVKAEKNNVTINGGAFTAVTALDLSTFTTGISQSAINSATFTNGTLVISSASNTNFYNIIISNINRFHHAEFEHH